MSGSFVRLVIDTATAYVYVALCDQEGNVLDAVYQEGHNDHSVTLMPTLQALFDRCNVAPSMLEEIVCGIGPGSYTGVRIGVTVAKTLAWTLNIPLKTTSSLALMASGGTGGTILAWIDARRGNGFYGLFAHRKGALVRLAKDAYGSMEDAFKTLRYDHVMAQGKPNLHVLFQSDQIKPVTNVHEVSPLYLRQTEAESKKE